MSTLYIHQPGISLLDRWGILDQVARSGAKKLDKVTYGVPGIRLRGQAPGIRGIDGTYAPRRRILDQIIAAAAVQAGAEFRDGTKVIGLLNDGGNRVCGVRLRGPAGREYKERTALTIGADGMRSTVAALAGAEILRRDPLKTCVYYGFWQDLPVGFEFYERPGNWVAVIPTNDDLTVVSAYFPQSLFPRIRKDPAAWFGEAVRETAPEVYERIRCAGQVERLKGTGDQQNFLRQAHGPGWALVGDAGCHMDTITARGITDAFLQASILASAIGDDLLVPGRLDAHLREFAQERNRAIEGPYDGTLAVADLELSESRTAMLRVISQSPTLTELYFSVVAGLKTMEDLLIPELIDNL
jgi:2-polyprenyl-6-methoxyphenol hydroxylase-like FAD-dependent oxidoreductase